MATHTLRMQSIFKKKTWPPSTWECVDSGLTGPICKFWACLDDNISVGKVQCGRFVLLFEVSELAQYEVGVTLWKWILGSVSHFDTHTHGNLLRMVSKLDKQIFTNEFESHLVPHSLVPHLRKKLSKLQLLHNMYSFLNIFLHIVRWYQVFLIIFQIIFKQIWHEDGILTGTAILVSLFGFYGISTFVGYLMPNPFFYK